METTLFLLHNIIFTVIPVIVLSTIRSKFKRTIKVPNAHIFVLLKNPMNVFTMYDTHYTYIVILFL